jgi:ubiquinol-cytochrome c reductase cytochrome b subunit
MHKEPSPATRAGAPNPFYPNHLFVEALAALAVFGALMLAAYVCQAPLEEMADPGDTTYVPRPEWYFLFYFQLLKYFEGSLVVVGTFFLPVLTLALLILLPFLDTSPTTDIGKRPFAAALSLAGVVAVVALTALSVVEDESHVDKIVLPPITEEQITAGREIFNKFCILCHSIDGKGGFMAPDLTQIGARANRAYIERVIINPQLVSQTTIMSVIPLSEAERHEVSAFLSRKK